MPSGACSYRRGSRSSCHGRSPRSRGSRQRRNIARVSAPQPPGIPDPPGPAQPPPAAPQATPTDRVKPGRQPSTWQPGLYLKTAVLLFVIAYTIAFVVENTDEIRIDFVFATAKVRLIWQILLLLGVGVVGGVLLSQLYRHRRGVQLAKKAGKARDARPDIRGRDEAVREPR
jgi:uncharacterized integral membrane protein